LVSSCVFESVSLDLLTWPKAKQGHILDISLARENDFFGPVGLEDYYLFSNIISFVMIYE